MSTLDKSIAQRFADLREGYFPAVMGLLEQVVAQTTPAGSGLSAMCAYHLETGGKRLRALLPLLVAETLGEDPARLVPFGAACEMLHNATLVHDDLQDGDLQRRGRDTVWHRYGAPHAINLGDAMFYYAVLLAQRLDAEVAVRERVSQRLLVETLRVIDGQEREFLLKQKPHTSVADYTAMVEGKTSGLFALPVAGAADICGAEPELVEALAESARHLGVLFQIQDDVLDLYGDKGRGMRGSDIAEGKRSALVVHAMQAGSADDVALVSRTLGLPREQTGAEEIEAIVSLFDRLGSLDYALDELERRRRLALESPLYTDRPALTALIDGLSDLFLAPIEPLLVERGRGRSGS
jgi:geranylgeranyl diphosphate synthase type I